MNGSSQVTLTTDGDGRAAVTLKLGPVDGIANNVVSADFGGDTGLAAIFTATGRVAGPVSETTVSGVVLDNSNNPIAGVTVELLQLNRGNNSNLPVVVAGPVISDSQGQFCDRLGAGRGLQAARRWHNGFRQELSHFGVRHHYGSRPEQYGRNAVVPPRARSGE